MTKDLRNIEIIRSLIQVKILQIEEDKQQLAALTRCMQLLEET